MPEDAFEVKPSAGEADTNPLATREEAQASPLAHVHRGVRCDTDDVGSATPRGLSPFELVLDASDGFVPLWAKGVTLHWRFRESSFQHFVNPTAAKAAVEQLFREGVQAWRDAAPIRFKRTTDVWDFEVVMRAQDNCNASGCVLASAFFPDAGRHQLVVYPRMFQQTRAEQVETMAHEVGHIFGLRHFFAIVKETGFPAEIFGTHVKFTIMNYGDDSKLTPADRADLKTLYRKVWAGQLIDINGTPIKLVRPYHASGAYAVPALLAAAQG